MKRTGWNSGLTFGGTPMTSRYTQRNIAATDHCVAIIRRCPACHEHYVARPEKPEHGCITVGVGPGDIRSAGAGQTGETLTVTCEPDT